jgi:choline dehydrogenase
LINYLLLTTVHALHLLTQPGGFGAPPGSHSIAVWIVVLNPLSRKTQLELNNQYSFLESGGSVTINSSDPFESPVIDVRFLQSNIDVFTGREAIKKVLNFFKAPIWRDYIIAPIVDVENLTDDALDQFIRNSASAAFHLVGTAAMSAKGAQYGVVDPDLRVKGASRLRIIDASVFPFVPSSHTQAGTYAIAERGADLVKKAWA